MTLLSVVKEVCTDVGVLVPTSVFSGITGNRTMQEMLALANEIAQRIAHDTRDWTKLKKVQTFTGDGAATAFNMPADYKRMLKTSNVWRSPNVQAPMRFVPDSDEWLRRRMNNDVDAWGEWTLIGGQMLIYPALSVGQTAQFVYLQRNPVVLAGGGFSENFMTDGDSFILGDRLLKLGMIWQWKAKKGSPYAEEMGTFDDALASDMGADSPAPTIVGRTPISVNARIAYPWQLPT